MVRVKRRYIVFKIDSKQAKAKAIEDQDFLNELTQQVAQSYGDFGVACLKRGYAIKKQDASNGYMILQVKWGVEEMAMSVLPLITKINDIPCRLNIVHLSGTMRGSLKHLRLDCIRNLRASIGKKINNDSQRQRPRQLQRSGGSQIEVV